MYTDILVPTDGSTASATAVEHAIDLASHYDATLHVLYVVDVTGYSALEVGADVVANALEEEGEGDGYEDVVDAEGLAFAERLVHAYRDHRGEVDDDLAHRIQGWSFTQMSQTDLNVLRLAMTELLYEPDVPPRVTMEMAVRLAKRFGGEDSGRFVNGVLASWYREYEAEPVEAS